MTAPTKPRKAKAPYVFGQCRTAELVAAGRVNSDHTPEQWHELCPGAIINTGGSIECHCKCGHPGAQAVRSHADLVVQIRECREDGKRERTKSRERLERAREAAAPPPGADAPGTPAEGDGRAREYRDGATGRRTPQRCHCGCGEMTKGGMFIAGHDMRLKGQLFQLARTKPEPGINPDPAVIGAAAELIARGWKIARIDGQVLRAAKADKYGWNLAPDLVIERRVAQRYEEEQCQ